MPKMNSEDLQKMIVAHTVKGQRYREVSQLAGKGRYGFILREQARREEDITARLHAALLALESEAFVGNQRIIADAVKVSRELMYGSRK